MITKMSRINSAPLTAEDQKIFQWVRNRTGFIFKEDCRYQDESDSLDMYCRQDARLFANDVMDYVLGKQKT